MPQNQPDTLMTRLKTETRELHTYAEKRPLQQQIAAGTVDRAAFAAYLGQLYLAHDALESALARTRSLRPEISAVATPERMRVPELERDLEYYGIDAESLRPEPATARFAAAVTETERSAAVALLGSLYVLEGSTNGGRFLARRLRQAWGLDGRGVAYLDPYGEEQAQRWADFKLQMDSLPLAAAERDAIVAAAETTFRAIADISDDVARRTGAAHR